MTSPTSSPQDTSSNPNVTAADADADAGFAQAFRDLARGEQTAQALEANLTKLERRLDELLADIDEPEQRRVEAPNGSRTHGTHPNESSKT